MDYDILFQTNSFAILSAAVPRNFIVQKAKLTL